MPLPIGMPKLSDTMTEGTLLRWCKKVGDRITAGDVVAEIETDKATMEMEAFDDGVLAQILVPEGAVVSVGQPMALLTLPGEKAEPGEKTGALPDAGQRRPETLSKTEETDLFKKTEEPSALSQIPPRVKASPLARKLAAARGVALDPLVGSGPGGRIIQSDVLAAAGNISSPKIPLPTPSHPLPEASAKALSSEAAGLPGSPALPASPITPIAPLPPGEQDRIFPVTGMRRVIAERLLTSKLTLPHFYLQIDVDAGPLLDLRTRLNAALHSPSAKSETEPAKLTVNDFFLKATATALARVPKVNAAWGGDRLIQYAQVHLAVAVAVEDGLVTPVLRDADRRSLRELSAAMRDLAGRARSKRLKPEEYQGGTFTLSNLGVYGIERFFAIINPPQAAILSVGTVTARPVVDAKGHVVVGRRVELGLSCDHRVVDGVAGSQFLAELRKLIENPTLMLF